MDVSDTQRSTSILFQVLADPDSDETFRRFTGKYLPHLGKARNGVAKILQEESKKPSDT